MPARRRHRRPRPGPSPARVVLDALDLLADPPLRPLPHSGVPDPLWQAWLAARPGAARASPLTLTHSRPASAPPPGEAQPDFDWSDVVTTLFRHLVLPDLADRVGVAALGTTVRLTHLDGAPLALTDPAARLRAHHVLRGHRVELDPGEVLAYATIHAGLHALLAAHPPGGGLDLRLVLVAADAGLSAADVVAAHGGGTLTPDRIAFLAAFRSPPAAPPRRGPG